MIDPVKRAEAIAALRRHAWTEQPKGCEYCDHVCGPPGRTLIHTRAGGLGADWELDAAIEFIEQADRVAWTNDIFGHDLVARRGKRIVQFQVPWPGAGDE